MPPRVPVAGPGEAPLRVSSAALDAIVAHALSEAPRECCGLLLGDERRIDRSIPARNATSADATSHYLIDPEDHFAAIREARSGRTSVVGAYHSHPATPAVPSPLDLEDVEPGMVCVIASLAVRGRPDVRAFVLESGNFRPLRLVRFTEVVNPARD